VILLRLSLICSTAVRYQQVRTWGGLDFLSNFFLGNCIYLSAKSTEDLAESLLYLEKATGFVAVLPERRDEYHSKLLANEGAIYLSLGNLDEARLRTSRALALDAHLTAALATAGIIFHRQGDNESAIRYLRQALAQNSGLLQARYFLVLSLYSGGHYNDAKVEGKGFAAVSARLSAICP